MSGWNKNPDGCPHAEAHFAYTAIHGLGLCGCGSHDAIVAAALNALRYSARPIMTRGEWQPGPDWGPLGAELLMHVIDNADLIDHGTSINGSWITPKGERLLQVMEGKPLEWLDDAPGFSCSDCPDAGRPA